MGDVFLAAQKEPIRRDVALKIIKLGMDTREVLAQFKKEQDALARMDHPNIAKVFDAGATSDGRPYFVMEYIDGESITDYCDRHQLPVFERLGLFIQVCQAIQHAHQKGVIHCDIKPSNVLVTNNDGRPVPKVIDFGIAQATINQRLADKTIVTSYRLLAATPSYMSRSRLAAVRILTLVATFTHWGCCFMSFWLASLHSIRRNSTRSLTAKCFALFVKPIRRGHPPADDFDIGKVGDRGP